VSFSRRLSGPCRRLVSLPRTECPPDADLRMKGSVSPSTSGLPEVTTGVQGHPSASSLSGDPDGFHGGPFRWRIPFGFPGPVV